MPRHNGRVEWQHREGERRFDKKLRMDCMKFGCKYLIRHKHISKTIPKTCLSLGPPYEVLAEYLRQYSETHHIWGRRRSWRRRVLHQIRTYELRIFGGKCHLYWQLYTCLHAHKMLDITVYCVYNAKIDNHVDFHWTSQRLLKRVKQR